MRAVLGVVLLATTVVACSGDEISETTVTTALSDAGPQEVVAGWIDAVIASDAERLRALVEADGLVVLAAVENGFTDEATQALLDSGIPEEFLIDYWASFRAGFSDFAGIPMQSIVVASHDEFLLGDVSFAAVIIRSGDGATSVIVARRGETWKVDLVGSFGAAFAAQLRRMLVNLGESPAGDRIRDAYRTDVVPGLLAAFRRSPGNSVLGAELERMALLLEE